MSGVQAFEATEPAFVLFAETHEGFGVVGDELVGEEGDEDVDVPRDGQVSGEKSLNISVSLNSDFAEVGVGVLRRGVVGGSIAFERHWKGGAWFVEWYDAE